MRRAGAVLSVLVVASACTRSEARSTRPSEHSSRPVVSEQGARIAFAAGGAGIPHLASTTVRSGTTTIAVSAPARVVASIATSVNGRDPVVLFEQPEAASTWSQYRQARVALARATTHMERVRDMYEHLAATAQDVTDAETDVATARAACYEHEAHLRALGFDPRDLEAVRASTAWLMAEVPEAELREVRQGGEVMVHLSSFPDAPVRGRAQAMGDVVDPVTRTVKVRVAVPNAQRRLLPGMYARVMFGDPRESVLVLPAGAVVTVEERQYVFVRTAQNMFERREVSLQRAGADSLIVRTGLADGDEVVTRGAMLLKGLSFGY
jgi:hypothetical protein